MNRNTIKLSVALGSICLLTLAGGPVSTASELSGRVMIAAAPSLAELAGLAKEHRNRIESIDVTYEVLIEGVSSTEYFPRSVERLRIDNTGRLRIEAQQYTADPANPGAFLPYPPSIFAWNGQFDTALTNSPKIGIANVDQPRQARTRTDRNDFLGMNLLCEPPENPLMGLSRSAIVILESPFSQLRPDPETIAGHECWVVDCKSPGSDQVVLTVWLDAQRGCIPLKQSSSSIVHEAITVDEISPQVWLVTKGTKTVKEPMGKETKATISVQQSQTGEPLISVNGALDPNTFDLAIPEDYQLVKNGELVRIGRRR